jgi:hypothetical protein
MLTTASRSLSLLWTVQRMFSVRNYMKTFQAGQVTRYHGHFRVDEYSHFDRDADAVQEFIKGEQKAYAKESSKWKKLTDEYYEISASRKEARSSTVP